MAGLDLSKVNVSALSEVGHEFELSLPEVGTKMDAFIKVRGANSKVALKFQSRRYNEQQVKENIAKKRGKEVEPMLMEDLDKFLVDLAVNRTIGWRGITDDGEDVPFTPENAERVYSEHTWIRDAVIQESNLVGNFL
jgi:hypothetical protein